MSATPPPASPHPHPETLAATVRRPQARVLLALGALAGPFVLTAGIGQAWARPGFHWHRHAPSLLALGEYGWVQTTNFIVAGGLVLALSLGMWRALRGQFGGVWAPRLVGLFGACHVLVGLFRTDPAFDFPPGSGAPMGAPPPGEASLSAVLHSLFGLLAFNVLAAAAVVLAGHFRRRRQGGWVVASLGVAAAIVAVDLYAAAWEAGHQGPARVGAAFDFRPLWALLPLVWGYLSGLALSLRRRLA